jgi:signal transduction histidine kinase
MKFKKINTLTVIYVIFVYVLLQLVWWGYSITKLNKEIYVLKTEISNQQSLAPERYYNAIAEAHTKLNKRLAMVVGEGAIFLLLLLLAFFRFRKILQRELEINAQQKNFLMAVTHELKSPIASARLQLETLQKRTLTPTQTTTLLTNANGDLTRLTSLVDNILFATTIDGATYPIHKVWTNVSILITTTVANYELMHKHKVQFTSNIQPNIELYCDSQAVVSILTNLLDNAIKFTSTVLNPIITVQLTSVDEHVQLSISDNGIGINDADKSKIFDKFYRVGNEETRQTKGSGLGLFIVQHLVQLHNGTIQLNDVEPQGIEFVTRF